MMTNLKANKKQYVVQVFLFSISGYISLVKQKN